MRDDAIRDYDGKNGNRGTDDGWTYRGRGYIQLTGRGNYEELGNAITPNVNLVENPTEAEVPEIAAKIAIAFWKLRVRPRVNSPTTNHEINGFCDTLYITRIINGGIGGYSERVDAFNKYGGCDESCSSQNTHNIGPAFVGYVEYCSGRFTIKSQL